MLSIIPRNKTSYSRVSIALLTMTVATCLGSLPARAVTCEDVRKLSAAEQDYWSKRLNLTSDQRHRIWLACYKDYHPNHPKQEELVLR
jgi:hypothetical protein